MTEYIATITLDCEDNLGEHTGLLFARDGYIWCLDKLTRGEWNTGNLAGADEKETLENIKLIWPLQEWNLRY